MTGAHREGCSNVREFGKGGEGKTCVDFGL